MIYSFDDLNQQTNHQTLKLFERTKNMDSARPKHQDDECNFNSW